MFNVIQKDKKGDLKARLQQASEKSPYPGAISSNTLVVFIKRDLRLTDVELKSLALVTKVNGLTQYQAMPIDELFNNIKTRIQEEPRAKVQMIKKVWNKMINVTGTPLENFKYDDDGNLSKEAVIAAFKEMKVILGEQLTENFNCILFPDEAETIG